MQPDHEAIVHVVDDDVEVRAALSRLLRSAGWRVADWASAVEFLAQAQDQSGPCCILLDVNLPGMSGPELHERMRQQDVDLPVIYLTGNGSVPISVRAMKQGALDFLEKPIDDEALLLAIAKAIAGHREALGHRDRLSEIRRRVDALSLREREVMHHVIAGRMNKQIASDLGIAEKTVKVHRGRVMGKFGVRSVADLVRLCDELGIAKEAPLHRLPAREP